MIQNKDVLNFDIERFEEEIMADFLEKKNWTVLVDGVSYPGLTEEEAEARAEKLRAEGKKPVIAETFSRSGGRTRIGKSRILTVNLSIVDESGLPLGLPEKKLVAERWPDGWTVKSENQPGEKGTGETRRQAVIDWFCKNQS